MINFRYHLLSLTAVFLALAIGLVLGTAALNGPAVDALSNQVGSMRDSNDGLRETVQQLEDQLGAEEQFVRDIAPTTLEGELAGRRVLPIAIGVDDPAYVDQTVEMLGYSAVTVDGRISMHDDFLDPDQSDPLLDAVSQVSPEGFTPPSTLVGIEHASALLAAGFAGDDTGISADDQDVIMNMFVELQMLSVDEEVSEPVDTVLIVTGPSATDSDGGDRNAGVVTFAEAFAAHFPTVLAATTTGGDGNAVTQIRGDAELSEQLSTVDNAATAQGQLSAVLALADQTAGTVGHYGTDDGAQNSVPRAEE